jgi:peptidoglycan hydrolase-like protein with peptidoglycan-binding domain
VKAFQRAQKLKATGVVDIPTWSALLAADAEVRLAKYPH